MVYEASYLGRVDDWGTQQASIDTTIGYCEWATSHLIDRYGAIICLPCKSVNRLLYISKVHSVGIADHWNDKSLEEEFQWKQTTFRYTSKDKSPSKLKAMERADQKITTDTNWPMKITILKEMKAFVVR